MKEAVVEALQDKNTMSKVTSKGYANIKTIRLPRGGSGANS